MTGISVIICCFNSSSRITPTLEYLAKQKANQSIQWEIILVNNASTDNTVAVAQHIWNKCKKDIPLLIVDQPVPGLSFAREKGLQVAKYEFLLFCDDDNWLNENYIQDVFKIMTGNANIGALGGYGIPYFETTPPVEIKKYAGYYATGKQGKGTGKVNFPHVYGAGCIYRKVAIDRLFNNGFIYQLTGRNGNKLLCGEDHELCYALFLSGYEIWASDKLTFYHFIPSARMTVDYMKKNIIGIAHSNFVLSVYKLLIANKLNPRPAFKSSWLWVVISKSVLLLQAKISEVKIKRTDELQKTELKAKSYLFSLFLKNRTTFSSLYTSLSNSNWISKN